MVLLNGKEILKCKKTGPSEYSFYTLNDVEFLWFRWNSDDLPKHPMGEYFIMNFLTAQKKIESKLKTRVVAGMGMNAKKNMQKIIDWLLSEKVLNAAGEIDLSQLDIFYRKYNENISGNNS